MFLFFALDIMINFHRFDLFFGLRVMIHGLGCEKSPSCTLLRNPPGAAAGILQLQKQSPLHVEHPNAHLWGSGRAAIR